MTNISLAAHPPSIPDPMEALNDKPRCASSKLAERHRRAAGEVRNADPLGAMLTAFLGAYSGARELGSSVQVGAAGLLPEMLTPDSDQVSKAP